MAGCLFLYLLPVIEKKTGGECVYKRKIKRGKRGKVYDDNDEKWLLMNSDL